MDQGRGRIFRLAMGHRVTVAAGKPVWEDSRLRKTYLDKCIEDGHACHHHDD